MKIPLRSFLNSKEGYALPSILLLVTVLSSIILSILIVQYLQRQSTLLDVAQVKADYAALNGINQMLVKMNSRTAQIRFGEEETQEYFYESQSLSRITFQQWGFYYFIRARGKEGRITSERIALAGSKLPRLFENALIFTNNNHQLVLSGTTHIKGDVITGRSGMTIGTLPDFPTPRSVPVDGKTKKESSSIYSLQRWQQVVDDLNDFVDQKYIPQVSSESIVRLNTNGISRLDSSTIPQNARIIIVGGRAALSGRFIRRSETLFILAQGDVIFQNDASLCGCIAVCSKKSIVVPSSVQIESAILFSQSAIQVEADASISAQLIAPVIDVHNSAHCKYPSVLVSSRPADPKGLKQEIQLENGTQVEGVVVLLSKTMRNERCIINLQSGAKLKGVLISEKEMTLDGSVNGIVLTKDFYFYSSPTTYFGWIRSGKIDRSALPSSFLIPMGFSEKDQLDILDWL